MQEETRALTKADILALPDAPEGQRANESPPLKLTQFARHVLDHFEFVHDLAEQLCGEAYERHSQDRFMIRATQVCRRTGLSLNEYLHLDARAEIEALKISVKVRQAEHSQIAAEMIRQLRTPDRSKRQQKELSEERQQEIGEFVYHLACKHIAATKWQAIVLEAFGIKRSRTMLTAYLQKWADFNNQDVKKIVSPRGRPKKS